MPAMMQSWRNCLSPISLYNSAVIYGIPLDMVFDVWKMDIIALRKCINIPPSINESFT